MRRVLFTLALVLFANPLIGREWYVNNTIGNDALSGRIATPKGNDGPLKRIRVALCLATPGDQIFVAKTEEPYREELSIAGRCLRGLRDMPLVIDGGGATLDGTVIAAQGAWRHAAGDVFALRPRRLTYQQLFSAGKPLTRVMLASTLGIEQELQPLQWALAEGQILVRTEANRLPDSYDLRHAGLQTGITLYNTHHVRVQNFIIQGFQQDGINAHELVRDCELVNVELRANGRSGLSVGGGSRVTVRNSNSYDNGVSQVRSEGSARIAILESDIDKKAAMPFDQVGGEITVDGAPVF